MRKRKKEEPLEELEYPGDDKALDEGYNYDILDLMDEDGLEMEDDEDYYGEFWDDEDELWDEEGLM